MSTTVSLDHQINKLGFWSAITTIILAVVSGFLPLDAPGGFGADHADRIAWLTANRGAFILGLGQSDRRDAKLVRCLVLYCMASFPQQPLARHNRCSRGCDVGYGVHYSQVYCGLDYTDAGGYRFCRRPRRSNGGCITSHIKRLSTLSRCTRLLII